MTKEKCGKEDRNCVERETKGRRKKMKEEQKKRRKSSGGGHDRGRLKRYGEYHGDGGYNARNAGKRRKMTKEMQQRMEGRRRGDGEGGRREGRKERGMGEGRDPPAGS